VFAMTARSHTDTAAGLARAAARVAAGAGGVARQGFAVEPAPPDAELRARGGSDAGITTQGARAARARGRGHHVAGQRGEGPRSHQARAEL
jgi:hypothetical protein